MNFGKQSYQHNFYVSFFTQPKQVGPLLYDNNSCLNVLNKRDDKVQYFFIIYYCFIDSVITISLLVVTDMTANASSNIRCLHDARDQRS